MSHTLEWRGRGSERTRSQMHAKLVLDSWDEVEPANVVLKDISADGAGLICDAELALGKRLLLQLPSIGGVPLSLHANVVGSRMLGPGRYRIGLQFDGHDSVALDRLRDALPG
jgi:hypothetical protein